MNKKFLGILFIILSVFVNEKVVGTSSFTYKGIEAIPLGEIRVTRYSHFEGGRLTASGYILKDSDDGIVCAVGRDWYKKRVKVGDFIGILGFVKPCRVVDTMAIRNRKGLYQTHWVDVYINDASAGLDFGIQHREAYLVRGTINGNIRSL